MSATDTAALIAEANEWRNEDPDSDTTEVVSERVTSLIGRLTDALESETNKESLTVRTVEELDALPVETVMLDRDFDAWKVTCETVDGTEIRYQCTDGSHYYTAKALLRHGPFRLVWNPVAS